MTFTTSRGAIKRGELAKRSGCHAETIRYYEKVGLLTEPGRSDGGHRLYTPADQARLGFIVRGRTLGFSINELHGLLSLVDAGSYTCADIFDRTRQHLTSVRAKIADLQRLEAALAIALDKCPGDDGPECPIIDTLKETA